MNSAAIALWLFARERRRPTSRRKVSASGCRFSKIGQQAWGWWAVTTIWPPRRAASGASSRPVGPSFSQLSIPSQCPWPAAVTIAPRARPKSAFDLRATTRVFQPRPAAATIRCRNSVDLPLPCGPQIIPRPPSWSIRSSSDWGESGVGCQGITPGRV